MIKINNNVQFNLNFKDLKLYIYRYKHFLQLKYNWNQLM